MEKMKWIKKGISALLALNMVLSSVPLPVFAVTEDNLCEHHPVHTDECGYVEAVAGSPCTHTHDDACGYVEAVEGSDCTHAHDEVCGYAEAVEGQPCGYECGECAAAAEAYSDLGIGYICAAGNGDIGLGNWVNGEGWNIEAESNIMTEVNANVYEITYTDLPASNNYALKFAADGVWAKSWGGTYMGSGVESDAVLGGSNISFPVSHAGSDVTLKLDLTGYDPDTQTGATFTVTVILPEEAGYTYDEETNTCTVTTANGLYHVAELVNNVDSSINITLAADIVLNENLADKVTVAEDGTVSADASVRTWTPLEGEYSGTFDGGNHTITGLYCADNGYSSTGLIGTLAEGATVINVKIHDFCLERDGGAVVGNNRGEVIGCSISGTGILGWTTGYQYVGGVVGMNEGTVKDCTSSAAMTFRGMGYFGGIVGNNLTSQATVIGCSNSGTITAAGYSYMKVGGILGGEMGTVKDCYNTGSIRATVEDGFVQVGGIAGFVLNTVSGCYNTGTVSGKAMAESSEASVGGIAGYAEGTVSGCYNTGNISGDATFEGTGAYAGGIAGFVQNTVSGCHNTGTISVTANAYSTACVGGITAVLNGTGSNCYNSGSLVGVGGEDCYVGGIAGECYGGGASNCYNIGSVDSGGYSGGIVAAAYGTVADCYYLDTCVKTGSTEQSSADGITAMSADQFASGEVAYLLNGDQSTITYRQTLGSDAAPSFTGGTVYRVGVTCTENAVAYANTQSDLDHNYTDGTCTVCGEVCDHSGSTNTAVTDRGDGTHGYDCTVCGAAVTGEHTGGTATCTTPAVCEACGVSYGEVDTNNHDSSVEYENGFCENGCHEPAALVTNENYESFDLKADYVGYYVISNAGQLFWFAQQVNEEGNKEIKGVLTEDIDLENRPWTPIGAMGEENSFRGVFDGHGGYTITGLNVTATSDGAGFFGEVRTGTVKNLIIYGNVVVNTGVDYVGGVIGSICGVNGETDLERNGAIIQNIVSCVNITVKANGVGMIGGFVGHADHQSLIEQCSWYGTFDAGEYRVDSGAGGFIGKIQENTGEVTIRNCGAYGTIKTNYAGDYNNTATIYMGGFLSFSNTGAKTTLENCLFAGKFERGENLTDQAFLGAFGTLRSVNAIKNCYYLGDDGLAAVHSDSNLNPESDNVDITSVTGEELRNNKIATWLGEYWTQDIHYPALKEYSMRHSGSVTYTDNGDGTHDKVCTECGYVEVVNEAHSGGTATCTEQAECQHCGAGYGEKKPHSFNDSGFCTVCNTAAQAKLVANSDGTVTYFATLPEALAAEHNAWDEVYALADYEGDITVPAGLCFYGENHTFSGDVLVEGGRIFSGTFNGEVQVYLLDTVEEGVAQGFVYGGTFRKAVFVGSQCVVYGGTFEAELELVGSDVFNFAGDKYHFALGENFTLILGGDTTIDCQEHFEPLGFDCTVGKLCRLCREALTDPQAAHTGSNSTCSTEGACQVCGTLYLDPDVHAGERTNGIWTCCGKYQIPEQDADGVYEIDNAGKLFWFAAQVNSGNTALNARLTADIDLENRAWTPIGNDDNLYNGSFDGSGKTIKGLYIHDEAAQYVGLFGAIYLNAHVKAVTLTDSSVTGKDYVGGIVGRNSGTVTGCVNNAVVSGSGTSIGGIAGENGGTVELCGNTNTVTSSNGCGGIVGRSNGTIRNCYNTGEVHATGTTGNAGGITFLNMGTVEYSWSTGKVTGGSNGEEGGIVGRNTDAVRYCCATQKAIDSSQYGATTNNVGTYTAAQFASGEVAYMLSSASEGEPVWGQTIGTDPYPVLGGAQVYHGYTSCGDTAAIYTNDETVSPEKPAHTGEADYTPTTDGKHHIARWSCCGTEVTEAHTGGTATCQTQAVCQHCGESYGELDPDNHEYETNNGICCDTYQSAALNAEGFYEIFNAGQLYWFARQVNIEGNTAAKGKLMADIDLENRTWYPIGLYNDIAEANGSPVQKQYAGTFDGNNHTVSNFTAIGNGSQGLFGYCNYSSAQIKNLGVINATVSGWNAGAVAGYCANLTNCYAVGCTITGASETNTQAVTISSVGGNNGPTSIVNCWAYDCELIVGEGEASYVMHPVGGIRTSDSSIVQNCYYGEIVTVATFTSTTGATEKTEAQFASGEVAYLLGSPFGQTIGTDSYPVLGGKTVYEITVCEKTAYSNTDEDIPHNFDEKGFCTATPGEIHYQPALDSDSDGFFEIGNAGQLFWFANHINTVDRTASAVLTADIDLEGRPWTPIGSTGESSNNFRGTFDGQNHTIKGLYVEGGRAGLGFFGEVRTGTVKNFTIYGEVVANTEVNYVGGVIGSICGLNGENDLERNGAVIQNITSFVNVTAKAHGIGMIGGFVGYADHQSLIEKCSWYGTFDAGEYRVDSGAGGFIGKIQENTSEVTIRNCGAYGTIKTNYAGDYNNTPTIYMGGFLSFSNTNAKTTLENCLFAGRFERGANLTDQAFLGAFGTLRSVNAIKNCYYLGDDGLEAVHSDSNLKPGSDNVEITSVTGERLKSGEVAYKLGAAWGQTIGTQSYPVLGGDKVYQVKNCKQEIAYNNNNENLGHNYVNGICTVCGEACEHTGGTATCTTLAVCAICGVSYGEMSTTNHDETVPFSDNGFCPNGCYEPAELVGSYFQITNAGQLYWFAAQVNSGYTNINGELKANIVVNENVLTADGEPNGDGSGFRLWTPIGTPDNAYVGDFCGFEHTVSGLYFNDSNADYVGLFGYVGSGTVNHVGVIDSYFNGSGAVGGVVGYNEGTVEYAYSNSYVGGIGCIGGVVGYNQSTVKYAYNTGTVSGDLGVGGVVGSNQSTVKYAYNTGSVSGETNVGGVAGENFDTATVTNCYFDSTVYTGNAIGADSGTATDVEGKTTEQFASGEIAYLLGYPFGQAIGTHLSPLLFMGDKVYYGYTSCGDVRMVYTNDPKASTEKPEHTGEATYTLTADGAQHIAVYDCCGTTVTEDHTYENGFCPCGLYDLWVAGEQISESHLTVSGTTGTATYDPKTDTLTLNDFDNGEKWCSFTNDGFYFNNAAVYTISDLNVVLEGENRLYVSGGNYNAAIQSDETVTIDGDGTLLSCPLYSANGTIINGGTLDILGVEIAFDGPSTTINGGSVNVSVNQSVTFGTLTVNGGRVVLENSYLGIANNGTILIGEGMAVYDENGALIENPDFSTLPYALIQAPCDHTQATASYTWTEDPITLTVTVSCTACGETFTGSTEDVHVTISDDGFTTIYTATVTLDGKDYTDTKIVSNEVTRVNITWGSMNFTYTDESGWDNPDTAWVQVENTGNTAVTVTYDYVTERTDITGSFFDGTATVTAPVVIDAEAAKKIWLRLDGRPGEALNNTTIGSVKLTIA